MDKDDHLVADIVHGGESLLFLFVDDHHGKDHLDLDHHQETTSSSTTLHDDYNYHFHQEEDSADDDGNSQVQESQLHNEKEYEAEEEIHISDTDIDIDIDVVHNFGSNESDPTSPITINLTKSVHGLVTDDETYDEKCQEEYPKYGTDKIEDVKVEEISNFTKDEKFLIFSPPQSEAEEEIMKRREGEDNPRGRSKKNEGKKKPWLCPPVAFECHMHPPLPKPWTGVLHLLHLSVAGFLICSMPSLEPPATLAISRRTPSSWQNQWLSSHTIYSSLQMLLSSKDSRETHLRLRPHFRLTQSSRCPLIDQIPPPKRGRGTSTLLSLPLILSIIHGSAGSCTTGSRSSKMDPILRWVDLPGFCIPVSLTSSCRRSPPSLLSLSLLEWIRY